MNRCTMVAESAWYSIHTTTASYFANKHPLARIALRQVVVTQRKVLELTSCSPWTILKEIKQVLLLKDDSLRRYSSKYVKETVCVMEVIVISLFLSEIFNLSFFQPRA